MGAVLAMTLAGRFPKLAALVLLVTLAACGNDPTRSQGLASVQQTFAGLFKPAQPQPSAAQIRAAVTPQVRAQLGGATLAIAEMPQTGQAALIYAIGRNGDVITYTTLDNITFAYDRGVLVATRGLGFDLITADVGDVQRALRQGGRAVRVHRYLDGEDALQIRSFICDFTATNPVREICQGQDTQFENEYQFDAGGRVIRSRQWVGPERQYLITQQLDE
jgi:hypothetical protein